MVNENLIKLIENKKPVEEVREIEEVRLPMLSEITDKDGKVKLPSELIEKLRDPQARFRTDLVVCPVGYEEWDVLKVSCLASGCSDTSIGTWRHSNCTSSYPSPIEWSTHAKLKCPSCYKILDISKWSFHCHGSGCTNRGTDQATLANALLLVLSSDKKFSEDFARLFLKNAKEVLR